MRELSLWEMDLAGGGMAAAVDGTEQFIQCMDDNWWHDTVTGAVSGAIGGAVFGPGAILGGIVGAVGGSTGAAISCGVSAIF
jgi:hypothetical protein